LNHIAVDPAASPCVKVCKLDRDRHYCMGCYRTRDEIANWTRSSLEEKMAVLEALPRRARLGRK